MARAGWDDIIVTKKSNSKITVNKRILRKKKGSNVVAFEIKTTGRR